MPGRPSAANLSDDPPLGEWPDLSTLTRHIVDTHHRYVRDRVPVITTSLRRLADEHGGGAHDLRQIRETFAALADELLTHLAKEEHLLFPYIDELEAARQHGTTAPRSPFGTIANPVRMMEDEHENALRHVARLRDLTHDYATPAHASEEHRRCFADLGAFDADLHRHIALENTLLFPRALDLEGGLT